jgi:hypothetical protein
MTESKGSQNGGWVGGAAALCGLATGLAGWIAAVAAGFSGQWGLAGLGLIASALAFGLLANAVFRN